MSIEIKEEKIRDISPTQIRIPSALKAKIKASAKANRRSISTEIVERLEASFADGDKGEYEEEVEYTKEEINRAFCILQAIIDKA